MSLIPNWWRERNERQAEIAAAIRQSEMDQRKQEREAYLAALTAITQVAIEGAKAHAAQAQALTTFLEGFKVTGNPNSRVVDEAKDFENYLRKTMHSDDEVKAALREYNLILDDPFAD